jgi:predicted protein tyrosine phosphatase
MIKSVIITALNEAKDIPFKAGVKQNLWISAVDPEDEQVVKKLQLRFGKVGMKHFYQIFRDWSEENACPHIQKNIEEQGPGERHVNSIISFLEPFVATPHEYDLGVNCFVGMSRSTAIGIIAWVMQGKTPEQALNDILDVRSFAWPNLRILRFASQRLGVDIYKVVKTWQDATLSEGIIT